MGDPEAEAHFSSYFDTYLSLKLRARKVSAAASDDVRQETLYRVLKILRKGKGIDDPARLGAFVNGVCNNVLREFQYKDGDPAPDDAIAEVVDSGAGADESMITAERKKAVEKILRSMSSKDREILRLVFFEDVERAEICRRLGASAGYVRVLLHRAKAKFEEASRKSYRYFALLTLLFCNAIATALTILQMGFRSGGRAWIINAL